MADATTRTSFLSRVYGLMDDARAFLQAWTAVALSVKAAVDAATTDITKLGTTEDTITAEIPQAQASLQEVSDRIKAKGIASVF
jgi:hypothetical protein